MIEKLRIIFINDFFFRNDFFFFDRNPVPIADADVSGNGLPLDVNLGAHLHRHLLLNLGIYVWTYEHFVDSIPEQHLPPYRKISVLYNFIKLQEFSNTGGFFC